MIELKKATVANIEEIQHVEHNTWPDTFGKVMSEEQINYMLELMYSAESLQNQMRVNHNFILVYFENKVVGFASYELDYNKTADLMIHKAYILPDAQGHGIGKKLFKNLTEIGIKYNQVAVRLKVFYKNEKAIRFYEKNGFQNTGIEETNIGGGYIIRDNVMRKESLTSN